MLGLARAGQDHLALAVRSMNCCSAVFADPPGAEPKVASIASADSRYRLVACFEAYGLAPMKQRARLDRAMRGHEDIVRDDVLAAGPLQAHHVPGVIDFDLVAGTTRCTPGPRVFGSAHPSITHSE